MLKLGSSSRPKLGKDFKKAKDAKATAEEPQTDFYSVEWWKRPGVSLEDELGERATRASNLVKKTYVAESGVAVKWIYQPLQHTLLEEYEAIGIGHQTEVSVDLRQQRYF